MNRLLSSIAVFVISCTAVSGQKLFDLRESDKHNIEVINNWISPVLKREIPNFDSALFKTGRLGSIPMVNFLSDDLFIPVFGEAYDKVGQDKATKIAKALDDMLKNRRLADKIGWVHFAYSAFGNYGYYLVRLNDYRNLRKRYEELVRELNDENRNILSSTYQDYKANYRGYFTGLFPGEIEQLGKLLDKSQKGQTRIKALKIVQATLDLPVAPSTIPQLLNYWSKNPSADYGLPFAEKEAFDIQFNEKLRQTVAALMKEEQAKIDALPKGDAGIEAGNRFYVDFKKNYYFDFYGNTNFLSKYFPEVPKTLEQYRIARLSLLTSLIPEIDQQIAKASAVVDLTRIFEKYLEHHPEKLTGSANDIDTRIRSRKLTLVGEMDDAVAALIKKQQDAYRTRLALQGTLKLDGVKDQSVFMRAWRRELNSFDGTKNESRLLFKMLLAVYSEKCKDKLPPASKRIAITTTDYTGSSYEWGWPFNKMVHNYQKREIAVFYIHPDYVKAFENFPVLYGNETPINIWDHLLVRKRDYTEGIAKQAVSLWLDGDKLISINGCNCQSLQTIMDNMNYYFSRYSPPFENTRPVLNEKEGYQYNETGKYYVKDGPGSMDIHYIDAPPDFVPPLDALLASNRYTRLYVHHEDGRSTGISYMELTGGVLTVHYNKRSLGGSMESAVARFWLDRQSMPSGVIQPFFKDVAGKPVKKLELEYHEKSTGK